MGTEPDDVGGEEARESGYSDRAEKTYRAVLAQELERGLLELDRRASGISLSGLSAGLDIGFGPLLMAMILTAPTGNLSPLLEELLVASAYAVGFIFVVLGRSNLFTEETTLAIIPVLDGQASLRELSRLWGLVYTSNLIGAGLFASFAVLFGPAFNVVDTSAFAELARPLVRFSWWATLLAAIFAGWLMGLLTWLVSASRETITALVTTWLVAMTIGFGHLPHSIAGTIEVLFGVLVGAVSVMAFVEFLFLATIGNIIGGVFFVGILKYGHATQAGRKPGRAPGESTKSSIQNRRRR